MTNDWVYDIETYIDLFCVEFSHVETDQRLIFALGWGRNDLRAMMDFISWAQQTAARGVGFNNENFDWRVMQAIVDAVRRGVEVTPLWIFQVAQDIITPSARSVAQHLAAHYGMPEALAWSWACELSTVGAVDRCDWLSDASRGAILRDVRAAQAQRFNSAHQVWPRDRLIPQIDLFKIHHFDNKARSTSLKKLEVNMRAAYVVDLPYKPTVPLPSQQAAQDVIDYMGHDVAETKRFALFSREEIAFRDELAIEYPDLGDVMNFNDTKIGKKFFEMELERNGTPCYTRETGRKQPRQTRRDSIALRDVISPRVAFQHPEFERVRAWLADQVLTKPQIEESLRESASEDGEGVINTKGVFKDLSCEVDGFKYDFGTGGIHGSVHKKRVDAGDGWEIWDWDVASYYPNLAIANDYFPAHLSQSFCDVYRTVYERRRQYEKGTAQNAMLKLALNGVYGDSNNRFGPFYDPQYTMAITINGQLMLCMLAEWLRAEGVQMIQINTDGLTVRIRSELVQWMKDVCRQWEGHTGLTLESAQYDTMIIRDVNSYIARTTSGKLKRIGAYAYTTPLEDPRTRERQWHQDHSMLIVRKAAEAHMLHGTDIAQFLFDNLDPWAFMKSVKVPRSSRLLHGAAQIQNTSRYYVSTDGAPLTKIMPPLPGKTDERSIGVETGWRVTIVNDASAFRWDNLNWYYYVNEARKLVID